MVSDRKAKQIFVLFFIFVLVSVLLIQSAISSEPKTMKTGNVTQLWKFPIVGSVCNSPVVKDGFVYVTASYVGSSITYGYCLNASTGSTAWNYTTNTYYYFPMVVDEGITQKLHRNGSKNMTFYAINATTGEEIWNTTKYAWLQSIAGGYLYLGDACFNATTGTKIWEYPTEGAILQPVIAGDLVYIKGQVSNDTSEDILYCLDAKTGTYMWNYTNSESFSLFGFVDNQIFVSYNDEDTPNSVLGNVIALSALNGNEIWNYTFQNSTVHNIEIANGSLYIRTNNIVHTLNASTGFDKWIYDPPEEHEPKGLVVANSSVYVSYGDSLHCLNASTGDTKWTRTDVDVSYGFYVFGDEVYFGTEGERRGRGEYRDSDLSTLYCLDAHTGTQIFNYTINGDPWDMVMVDGILYVGADYPFMYPVPETGYVYALKPTIDSIPEFPSWTILPLVLTITLFSVMVKRKLHKAKVS